MATLSNIKYVFTKYTSAQWLTDNPILSLHEIGIERDTHLFKIGDGIRTWNQLPYVVSTDVKGILIFVSEDQDNLIVYGEDGGVKLTGEYFNALQEYNNAKQDPNIEAPTKTYHKMIFTIGKDIFNIQSSISEINNQIQNITIGSFLDDTLNNSIEKTWSINKIKDQMDKLEIKIRNFILGNHQASYDALQSLAQALDNDPNMATSIANELGNCVKTNIEQNFTLEQQTKARNNIGAVALSELGEPFNLVEYYNNKLNDTAGSTLTEREV